ncbi:Spo0E family sporulation regulatory protein-aspartic acid phosphatase [Bacillaceae bacterium C204]|jgi:hypothetical protein|uniref:Spo0E family sporulation regulatory protein-aspartic acid phosphatase n=1 Tax=Neobacillus sp. 204 TaxID=3383351 RepID=UPI00397E6F30
MKMLEMLIERKRKKMIALAEQYGLSGHETIQVSKELDQLIILYQKIIASKNYNIQNHHTEDRASNRNFPFPQREIDHKQQLEKLII